ncbi:helix-turn-helix domain-containing protein [Paenibacillus thiaminolyticus]|uniref:GH39 family glycosyl hydrolase n=1 Tax=Paenibacillus thiaminolyticus TaxID=49283 RepID=UPI0035A606D6
MNPIYEFVETDEALPFDVSLHSVNYVPNHWHSSMEIIFVLRGTLEATVNQRKYALSEGDVLLINQGHVHEVIGLDVNIIATFLIPFKYMKDNVNGVEAINFACYSGEASKEEKLALDHIRQCLAEMVQLKHKKGEGYELDMQARMLSVFSILLKQFKQPAIEGVMNEKYMDRMLRIITFIDEHYQEPITLQAIAEREYLSVPYLSKFFSENIGLNFQAYLTSIRLKNTVEDLLRHADAPIADLAMNHGFPNAKSFYAAFKAKYHMTPNEYRKQYRPPTGHKEKSSDNYLAFNQTSALGIINQYLQRSQSVGMAADIREVEEAAYEVDLSVPGEPIRHTWKQLITIGKAKEGLHADVQEQLRHVQRICPFRYLRFHGIFDDEMMVYDEDEAGQPRFNFRFVDQLFDFLLSVGLKPFVELGFMPSLLADDPGKKVFYKASCVSKPKSIDRWCLLVDRFLRHCLNRYGAEEVETWKFEFWNEPELKTFWPGTMAEYMELYLRTYHTLKSVSERLRIGAPGRIITIRSHQLNDKFFAFCRRNQCLPDFIPLHFYPHENIEGMLYSEPADPLPLQPYRRILEEFIGISPNPDFLRDMLAHEMELLAEQGLSDKELVLTEWNSTAYHRELTNDTVYKAAYLAKNMIDNLDRISGFGYWVLSDNIEETAASAHLYHGGLGLIAQHGIPKAAFVAYELLAKLGDRLLARGDRYIATAGRGGYQILTFNYCHFDDLYAMGDTSFINATNRYNGFKNEKTVKMQVELKGIRPGAYRVVTYTIGRKHGSSYDRWVEMGAPEPLSAEDIAYLKANSGPRMHVQYVDLEEDRRTYISVLEPHGVQLMELIPVY